MCMSYRTWQTSQNMETVSGSLLLYIILCIYYVTIAGGRRNADLINPGDDEIDELIS